MTLTAARALRADGRHAEARDLLVRLLAHEPDDPELQFEAACVHDHLGEEAAAIPCYRAAIAKGLSGAPLRSAFLGLGSTYRTLGRYVEAEATLREGLAQFPHAPEIEVFLAMTLHNRGQSKAAVEGLLRLLAESSQDAQIQAYRRAILFYAEDVDRTWPADG